MHRLPSTGGPAISSRAWTCQTLPCSSFGRRVGYSLARKLQEQGYYTLVIEASFVAMERTVEFRLLERGTMVPTDLPGTHPGVYREAAAVGIFDKSMANDLADLWRDHRAKTYYQDGLAAAERAERMDALAREVHAFVVGRSAQGHECLCE